MFRDIFNGKPPRLFANGKSFLENSSKLSTRIVPYFSNLIIWLSVASSGFEAAAWLRVSQPFSPEIDDNNQDQTSL